MKKVYAIYMLIIIVIILVAIEFKIHSIKSTAPQTILIFIKDSDGVTPVTGASCKADILKNNKLIINDKELNEIQSMFKYINIKKWDIKEDRGYYELKTGFENYQGNFEIKIVCISPQNRGVSYTILNNTNLPCEVKDGGYLIC